MKKIFFILVFTGLLFQSFTNIPENISTEEKLEFQIDAVKEIIAADAKYNKEIAFFIDMEIGSGKNRFFIYDLKNKVIIDQGLVAHGIGSESRIKGKLKFSNTSNSFCTSLGRYSVGKYYTGEYGKSYKLYGLDETNSNAFARNIVLHSYKSVPFIEQAKNIVNSLGCPMVNELYFKKIEKILDTSKTNIILSIYN
jgi:hypothetical protein